MEIEVSNLHFTYGNQAILAVQSVKFTSGKIYGIVGRNGAGKTTFFKALTNIITNYRGSVLLDGQDVRQNSQLLTKVGITLDDMELYKNHSGSFNLRYFGGLCGNYDEGKALEIAKALNIDQALVQNVSQYSLGMTKKLILLISLMNDADILIFDEPFRGIDSRAVDWLYNYLKQLRAAGKLILISSHVQEDIERLCDDVFLLKDGDFGEAFDLKASNQTLIYTVAILSANQKEQLIAILSEMQIRALTKENLVRFDSTVENFQEVFRKAVAAGIEFDEIKKESKFADILNQKGDNQ